ncbi:class I SAM-dependent methyltransferase [Paraburkholderia sp.]|uniref:class I SAM-dependent methyltransferase n=1 Tax=Paraburkholderia sp. TaxID=1926495 RepID=UPI002387B0FB|nr:class I SAM-dependent methyltransferase [Paraburkholderia sp.]MDE1180972.1 class I SAM-dependent methyltransferase [Paraburkholderia sp.]
MSLKSVVRSIVPRKLLVLGRLYQIFFNGYGHVRRTDGMPTNGEGKFQPWLTYPLIEYLNGFDFSDKNVFEFGAGASTLFWAERAQTVTSVEFDQGWYDVLKRKLPGNVTVLHDPDGHSYAATPKRLDGRRFDVVVVDGAERYISAQTALDVLAPGGMIVLDNAEWYPNTANMLALAGLIEVRFSGFSPINAFTATSSVFLSREFAFRLSSAARKPPVGGTRLPEGALDDGPPSLL